MKRDNPTTIKEALRTALLRGVIYSIVATPLSFFNGWIMYPRDGEVGLPIVIQLARNCLFYFTSFFVVYFCFLMISLKCRSGKKLDVSGDDDSDVNKK